VIVKPETVIAWHRKGCRLYWSWKSRHRQGRPSISREVIDLIRKMSMANPRWGAPRVHGELLKLGFEQSESTVAKYMVGPRKPAVCIIATNESQPKPAGDILAQPRGAPLARLLAWPSTYKAPLQIGSRSNVQLAPVTRD